MIKIDPREPDGTSKKRKMKINGLDFRIKKNFPSSTKFSFCRKLYFVLFFSIAEFKSAEEDVHLRHKLPLN